AGFGLGSRGASDGDDGVLASVAGTGGGDNADSSDVGGDGVLIVAEEVEGIGEDILRHIKTNK
ncbi:MAG: hypothetical protein MI867_21160, partial [Pseudomonadales bacterium]|nr:hypothetical protein [Pseudomonadales bacterium]